MDKFSEIYNKKIKKYKDFVENSKTPKMNLIKSNACHLSVRGAYVGDPTPGVYGLKDDEIIASNDATSLYPVSEILSNIGYETLWGRIYDINVIDKLISLFQNIQKNKDNEIIKYQVFDQALSAFENAIIGILKKYTSTHSVKNKNEYLNTNLYLMITYFAKISKYLLTSNSKDPLNEIFNPADDITYFLIKSNLYPLFESIQWLSEKNKGYSTLIIDWVYHNELFEKKYKDKIIYGFSDINNTKTKFFQWTYQDWLNNYKKYVLNPFGTLFYKHKDKLAYSASENIEGLKRRRKVKNAMLCLEGLFLGFNKINSSPDKDKIMNYFKDVVTRETPKLSEKELYDIFMIIDNDPEKVQWRIESLKDFEWVIQWRDVGELIEWIELREGQLNGTQLAIKISLNSGYGIFGLISWGFSSSLVGNSITNTGKIYGIKTFQRCTVKVLENE